MKSKMYDDMIDIKKEMLSTVEDLKENLPGFMKETVTDQFKKDGIVIGVSGGVDSALIATLAVEALGANHVYGLILPEKESTPSSRELALQLCKKLRIPYGEVPITPMLQSFGIYAQKESLLRELFSGTILQSIRQTCFFHPVCSGSLLALPSIRSRPRKSRSVQNVCLHSNI